MKAKGHSKNFDVLEKKTTPALMRNATLLLTEVKEAFGAYFTVFNKYTADFFEAKLNEATRKADLEDINSCLIRIINAIISLAKSIDAGSKLDVESSNANFIDIVGTASNINARYKQIREKDALLTDVHSDFIACLKILNDDIILKYNATNEKKVYTIQEAHQVYKNMDSDIYS